MTVTEQKEIRELDDIKHHWLDTGVPLFIGDFEHVTEHVEANGFDIYYILAEQRIEWRNEQNHLKSTIRPQVFKVINNMAGRAITTVDMKDLDLAQLEGGCWFNLPKIPVVLWQKIYLFLRNVDKKHGTEGIVLLTYDKNYDDENGWGVLIPKQENTGHHCDYDQEAVIDELPDDASVRVVGSIHSHPNMDAYASGTDHHDQTDFDGVHLTFAWKDSKPGVLDIHAEMQMGGENYHFEPEDILEQIPLPSGEDEEVDKWIEDKVTKKAPTTVSTSSTGGTRPGNLTKAYVTSRVKAPEGCPDVEENIVIGRITANTTFCPFCATQMIDRDRDKRRCMSCHQFLAVEDEGLDEIFAAREAVNAHNWEIDVSMSPPKPIYFWEKEGDEDTFQCVYDPNDEWETIGGDEDNEDDKEPAGSSTSEE